MMRRATTVGAAVLLAAGIFGCAAVEAPSRPGVRAKAAPSESEQDHADANGVYVVLKLDERRVYVMQRDLEGKTERRLDAFRVAIGRREYETPTGRFEVTEKIMDPDWVQFDWDDPSKLIRRVAPGPANPLGVRWIGFTRAYGWGIGFHGTPQPELIGQAVSHGCVRMRNRDIVKLYSRVRIGTPVIVKR